MKAIRADGCGTATPFLAVSMAIALGFGLLAICGVLPDLGTHGPMFLSVDATTCAPVFTAVAIALALGLDAAVAHSSPHDDETTPPMLDANEE